MRYVKPNQHGQITIPADLRAKLGITQDTRIQVKLSDTGEIVLMPVVEPKSLPIEELHKHFQLTMSHDEFEQLINEGRSEI